MLKNVVYCLGVWFVMVFDSGSANPTSSSATNIEYPTPRRDDSIVNVLHGVQIPDPYQWMEDPDSEETKKFVDQENAITESFIGQCKYRADIKARLTQLIDYPRYAVPFRRGDKYFFYKNTGLQNHSVLYIQDSLDGEPRVFFDPNALSEDGTVGLKLVEFSEDGQIFAYGLSSSGSDWFTVHFRHMTEGDQKYPETLEKLKFTGLAWTHDNKGFFYGGFNEQKGKVDGTEISASENQKLYYHLMGTRQEQDVLVAEFSNPKMRISSEVSDCGRYLIIYSMVGCTGNRIHISDLSRVNYKIENKLELITIVPEEDADFNYVTNTNSLAIFRTNKDAPNFKLILIDFNNPDPANWRTLIRENEKDVLEWVQAVNEKYLIVCYIRDVKNILQLHNLETGEKIQDIPIEMGEITDYEGQRKYKEFFYKVQSFLSPGTIHRLDLSEQTVKPQVFKQIQLPNFDPQRFNVEQVFYPSKDGKTMVPMFIVYKKGLRKNGKNPCMLYAYGGFSISMLPSFSQGRILFIDNMNGVYALANIRGGGEYGETWHKDGIVKKKQNSFDDFQAAAEYLIKHGYTSPESLIINGASNGGLLVAASANQRPDLFKAVIANVGVMDMLKFHEFTIGSAWISDFGSPDVEEEFQVIQTYSPLHNIMVPPDQKIQYPAILLTTGDHDDRVSPLHSLKFIAELQHTFRNVERQSNPLLIRIETDAGHGAEKPTAKIIEEWTDIYSFICQTVGITFST